MRQLARDLDVAAGTVAKVYRLLEQEGLVASRAGAGTRVSPNVLAPPAAVVLAARALAETAWAHDLTVDEAISTLRTSWIKR